MAEFKRNHENPNEAIVLQGVFEVLVPKNPILDSETRRETVRHEWDALDPTRRRLYKSIIASSFPESRQGQANASQALMLILALEHRTADVRQLEAELNLDAIATQEQETTRPD